MVLVLVAGCGGRPAGPVAVEAAGLHNVFRVTPGVYSGSGPEGEADFRALARLGVRTVISVDGARPDAAAARREGMRTVHLPVGYDGIARERALELARAVRDLPGPVYVHCHHGQHRGPAAVAAAGLCLGTLDRAGAAAWLRAAGTDARYVGLIGLPERLALPGPGEIDGVRGGFAEAAAVSGVVEAMVEVDARMDRLGACAKAGWKAPAEHPDVDPPHEALLLAEGLREAGRGKAWATEAEAAAKVAGRLEAALRAGDGRGADAALAAVRAACVGCHGRRRD